MTDAILKRIFEEEQSSLPAEERIWQLGEQPCLQMHDRLRCTKKKEHSGDHAAHDMLGSIVERWPQEAK